MFLGCNFQWVPVHDCDENIQAILSDLGFVSMGDGERYIRGIVEPRPRNEVNRLLLHAYSSDKQVGK